MGPDDDKTVRSDRPQNTPREVTSRNRHGATDSTVVDLVIGAQRPGLPPGIDFTAMMPGTGRHIRSSSPDTDLEKPARSFKTDVEARSLDPDESGKDNPNSPLKDKTRENTPGLPDDDAAGRRPSFNRAKKSPNWCRRHSQCRTQQRQRDGQRPAGPAGQMRSRHRSGAPPLTLPGVTQDAWEGSPTITIAGDGQRSWTSGQKIHDDLKQKIDTASAGLDGASGTRLSKNHGHLTLVTAGTSSAISKAPTRTSRRGVVITHLNDERPTF
jgi:hypothetical protein